MRKIDTALLTEKDLVGRMGLWIYNGLDNCVTHEVLSILEAKLTPNSSNVYRFSRSLQGPALAMMRRGVLVDSALRSSYIHDFSEKMGSLERLLNLMGEAVWEKQLNARSPVQLQEFFYRSMGFTPIVTSIKGVKKISMRRETLEKLSEHFYAQPIISTILKIRDLGKMVQTLSSGVDSDGRLRAAYNVAGTETGRWSSSKNVFGRGTNFQNITPSIRDIFIADLGFKMCYADLEQAESRVVAYESEDDAYIEACEGSDLHSIVAKMVFGIDDSEVRKPYYRHFSFRDIAKRAGHATNYNATPFTLSRNLKLPTKVCEEFQHLYFARFPGIRRWHHAIQVELQTKRRLVTALGRERQFFGRQFDDATLREAIAYKPQSTVGDLLNIGLHNIYLRHEPRIQLLAQIHDAVLFQYPEDDDPVPVASCLSIPIKIHSRTMLIPVEVKIGYDWKNMASPGKPCPPRHTATFLDMVM